MPASRMVFVLTTVRVSILTNLKNKTFFSSCYHKKLPKPPTCLVTFILYIPVTMLKFVSNCAYKSLTNVARYPFYNPNFIFLCVCVCVCVCVYVHEVILI
jgi:hypothetical protein